MAEEQLTLRMRTRGAARTAAEVKAVGEAVDDVDDNTVSLDKTNRRTTKSTNALGGAIRQVIARMIVMGAIIGVLGVGLGGLAGAIGVVALAFGATLLPIAGIAIAAMITWEDQVKKVGSEAWKLNRVAGSLKRTFVQTFGPAVNQTFIGIRRGLRAIQPLLASLRGPLRVFGQALGGSIELFMRGIGEMGPEIRQMILAIAPLMRLLVKPALALAGAFVQIATGVAQWLSSSQGLSTMESIWAGIKAVAGGFWEVLEGIWEIAKLVWKDLMPEGGEGFVGILHAIGGALKWVADNWNILGPIVYVIGAALIAFFITLAIAGGALVAALSGMGAVVAAVIGGIAALVVALYMAYKRNETFRNAVNWLWRALKNVARWIITAGKNAFKALVTAFNWVSRAGKNVAKALVSAWGWVKRAATNTKDWVVNAWRDVVSFIKGIPGRITSAASGMFDGIKEALRSAVNWVINAWNGLELGPIKIPLAPDIPAIGTPDVPTIATGGTVRRGGVAVVGERGPEIVNLPTGSRVHSNQMSQALAGGGGDTLIAATFITPDGEVLARQTVRAARRKQSTR